MAAAVSKHLHMAIRAGTDLRAVDHHEDLRDRFPSDRISGIGSSPQVTDMSQAESFPAISQKPRKADAVESLRQDMEKETPDKLIPGKEKDLLLIAVGIVCIAEHNALSADIFHTGIAYGSAVCIAGEVLHGVAIAVESLLEEGDPVDSIEMVDELFPSVGVLQAGGNPGKGKPA